MTVRAAIAAALLAVLCIAAVSAQSFNRNLVRNNNADQGSAYWARSSGGLGTTSRSCSGKVGSRMFDGGRSSYTAYYQDIYVGGSAMSAGSVSYFLSARLGGYSFQSDRASVQVQFLTSSRSALVNSPTLGPVSRSDRGWSTKLMYKSTQSCSTHKSAYYARVWMRFYRSSGSDNDGFADDIQLILYQNRPTFALNRNLVGAPGAESSRFACSWLGSPKRTTASATNKVGSWMYYGGTSSYGSMYQDLQVNDPGPIDRGERAIWASARQGAYRYDNDYARVLLYFYTSSMSYLGYQYLPDVTRTERGSQSKLIEKTATKCNIPKYTRVVRFYVTFSRRTGSGNDAWVDQLDLRLVSITGPSFAWQRNLVNAYQADNIAYSCIWTSVSGYSAMGRSTTYISGRSGTNYYVGPTSGTGAAEQWIDVSSAQVAIDKKFGVLRYYGALGGKSTSIAELWVLMGRTRSASSPLQSKKLTQVARGDRYNSDRLRSVEAYECAVPAGTRWIRIRLVLRSGGGGAAMADAQTLELIQDSPPTFGLHNNLVNQPNPQKYYSCVWAGSVSTTTRWSVSGTYRFASTSSSGSLKQQIDVSAEAPWIDTRQRSVDLSGGLGGYATITNAPKVVFTFLKADKTAHHSVTIGPVTKADRGSRTVLLPRVAAAVVPANTRYIEVTQVYSGSYSMVGDLRVVLRENTLTPSLSLDLPITPSTTKSLAPSVTHSELDTDTHPITLSFPETPSVALSTTKSTLATESVELPHTATPNPTRTLSQSIPATGTEFVSGTRTGSGSAAITATGTLAISLTMSHRATPSPMATETRRVTPTAPHTLTHNPTWTGRPTPTLIPTVSVPITRTPDLPTPGPTPVPTPAPTPLPTPAPRASGSTAGSTSDSGAGPRPGSGSTAASTSTPGTSGSTGAATPAPSGTAASGSHAASSPSGHSPASGSAHGSGATPAPGTASGSTVGPTPGSGSRPASGSAAPTSGSGSAAGTPAPPSGPTPEPTPAPPPRTRTISATIQPPPPPTPAPPEIVSEGLAAAAQATSGLAGTAGVVAASPAAAAQLGRVVAVLFVAEYCGRGALSTTTKLPFLLSPTGLGFGPDKGKYYRGGVLGNVALMAGAALIVTVVVGVLRAVHAGSIIEAAAIILFPSCLLLVAGLLLTGSVLSGVAAGLSGGSPGLDWAMFFVALLVGGSVMAYSVYFSFIGTMMCAVEYIPTDDDADPNRRKRNMCYRFATFVWSDRGVWRPKAQQMDRLDVPRLRMHALLYDKYRGKALQRWLIVDLAGTIAVGLAAGIAPASCLGAVWGVALVLIALAVGAFLTRPYIFTLKNVLFCLVCGLAAIAALLVAVAVQLGGGKPLPDANESLLAAAANVVVLCMFFIFISVVVSILKLLTGCRKTSDPKRLNAQFADELEAELRAHGDLLGVRDEIDMDDVTDLTSGSSSTLLPGKSQGLSIPLSLNNNDGAGGAYTAPAVGTIGGGRQRTMSRVRRAAEGYASSASSSSDEEAGKTKAPQPAAQRVNPITGNPVPATPLTTAAAPGSDTMSHRPSVAKSKSSRGVMSSSEDSDDLSDTVASKPSDAAPPLPLLQRAAPAASSILAPSVGTRRTTGLTSSDDDDDFATSDSGSDGVLGSTVRNSSIVATTHRTSLGGGTLLGNNASMISRPSLVSPDARPATTASGISDLDSNDDLTEDEDL